MGRRRIHDKVRIRRPVDRKIEVRAASACARREATASEQLRLLQNSHPPRSIRGEPMQSNIKTRV